MATITKYKMMEGGAGMMKTTPIWYIWQKQKSTSRLSSAGRARGF